MIAGSHLLLFSENVDATRTFFRDTLKLDSIDVGHGWLIFDLPPAEMGIHPDSADVAGKVELWLLCQNITEAQSELEAAGVELVSAIEAQRFGKTLRFKVRGAGEMGIYEPLHDTFDLPISEDAPGPLDPTWTRHSVDTLCKSLGL